MKKVVREMGEEGIGKGASLGGLHALLEKYLGYH